MAVKPKNNRQTDPSRVIKIECTELPEEFEDEGEYELSYAVNPKRKYFHNLNTIRKELDKIIPHRSEDILDRLQNFLKVYIDLDTEEIFTQ